MFDLQCKWRIKFNLEIYTTFIQKIFRFLFSVNEIFIFSKYILFETVSVFYNPSQQGFIYQ